MLKNKIRVITYLRVGSKDQVTIFRKNEQLRELLEMHKDDWEIIDNAFDYGVSGRKENRLGLNYVLEMCNKNQVDMVVTLTPAMLARDVLLYKDIYTSIRNSEVIRKPCSSCAPGCAVVAYCTVFEFYRYRTRALAEHPGSANVRANV